MRINPFKRQKKENPAWQTFLSLYSPGQAIWTSKRYDDLAKAGYQNCATVFACVTQIVRAASQVDWYVMRNDAEIERHPILDLFDRPNEYDGRMEFLDKTISHLLLAGNSYILGISGVESQPPRFLYNLRPDRMSVVVGNTKKFIAGYEYDIGGQKTVFTPQQILHLKEFHPTDDFYGLSRIEVVSWNIDIVNTSMQWNKRLIQNDMRPAGALSTEGTLLEPQFQRLKNLLKEQYQGYEHAGEPLLLEGGLKWQQMSSSAKEMDWVNTDKINVRRICAVFGVAPELIGDSENKTYSNYQEARKALYIDTVLPIMDLLKDGFNFWLMPKYGENFRLEYDRDSIEALQEERAKQYAYLTEADWLTVNEKRLATGYDEVKGGDVVMISIAKVPLIPTSKEPEPEPMPKREPEPEPVKFKSENKTSFWQAHEKKRALWDNFVSLVKAKERALDPIAKKFLLAQTDRVNKEFSGIQFREEAHHHQFLDNKDEAKRYVDATKAWYVEAFKHAGNAGIAATKGKLYIYEKKGSLFEVYVDRMNELEKVIYKVGDEITEATKAKIKQMLERADAEDWTVGQLATEVKAKLSLDARYRAERIARTESAKIENWGNLEGYKQAEFVEKKGWLCSFVPDSRQAHIDADRQYSDNPILLDEPFMVGGDQLQYPGDPAGNAGNIINCLCSTYPEVVMLEGE